MNREDSIRLVQRQIAEIIVQTPKGERGVLLHRLLDNLYIRLDTPSSIKFIPTKEQRRQYIKKLSGKEFYVTLKGVTSSVTINENGMFENDFGEFSSPSTAFNKKYTKGGPYDFAWAFNGWAAKDKQNKTIDDYIRELIIKG